jgi:D-lyxose ketol-isomerase
MKRSEINRLIKQSIDFTRKHGFLLPPFAFWSPAQWRKKGHEADEIRDCMLGWDITDFGLGNFKKIGLVLFTIRNGRLRDRRYQKTYCEKMLIIEKGQICPMHFHWNKAEDIINRGGGVLAAQLYNSTSSDQLAHTPLTVSIDGVRKTVKAGGIVRLKPGESIFLPSRLYHKFWGEKSKVLLGEVSKVNDDTRDNRFYEKIGRFPEIVEDEPPRYLLFSEYPRSSQT